MTINFNGGVRSIPALAGEPNAVDESSGLHRVYPRVGGGTVQPAARDHAVTGLSPRWRGNHLG